jgi:hypothetical protein
MHGDLELPLIAAALGGGIIGASVPMSADEAVAVYNKVKDALHRKAQVQDIPLRSRPGPSARHNLNLEEDAAPGKVAENGHSRLRKAADE